MHWIRSTPVSTNVFVPGDRSRLPTVRLLKHWYVKRHWKKMAVIEVDNVGDGYHVGFLARSGECFITKERITTPCFAALIGREQCRFFAVRSLDNHDALPVRFMRFLQRDQNTDPRLVTRV